LENRLLSTAQWKFLLVALALFLFGMVIWPLTYWQRFLIPTQAGTLAVELAPPDHDYRQLILGIAPNSPLAAAGAQPGDQLSYLRQSDGIRRKGTDELIPVRLTRHDGQSRDLLVRPVAVASSAPDLATYHGGLFASTIAALAIGFLIGFRCADSNAMRIMSLSLMSIAIEFATLYLPASPFLEWCYKLLWPLSYLTLYVGLPYFTLQLPQSAPHWHRSWVRKLFYAFAAAWTVEVAAILLYRTGMLPLEWQALVQNAGRDTVLSLVTVAIVLGASWCSWRQSSGAEKQRMAWLGVCFGLLYFWFSSDDIRDAFGLSWKPAWLPLVKSMGIMSCYLGLGYAILRHKVFDLGFAINRVLVYSLMSTMLLTLFALTEFGVDKLLHFEGREKNVIFDAAVALGIILTFHRIQHWVNHRVDHVFFHHWQAAADRLRHFVERASSISEPEALQTKFMRAVEEFADARGSAIYWADASGTFQRTHATLQGAPAAIDANHDVAIELRHTRGLVELAAAGQSLHAELALPLLAHNEVAGLMLVGAKDGGHSYRPDELSLLATTVPRICMVLETLRLQMLERTVAEMDAEIKRLTAQSAVASAKADVAEMKLAAAHMS
jgi:hypothetical protein